VKYSALNYALRLVSRRDYTVFEVAEKLKRKEYSIEEITATLKKLQEIKFLDDTRFTKNYIENQRSIKQVGNRWLYMRLVRKGISKDLIEEYLKPEGNELVREAAKRWLKKQGEREIKNKKEKLMMFLARRGFNYGDIVEIVKEEIDGTVNTHEPESENLNLVL